MQYATITILSLFFFLIYIRLVKIEVHEHPQGISLTYIFGILITYN